MGPHASAAAAAAAVAELRFPTIDGLRAFEAAERLGSFERAADELHITASAVSKRVATVEDLLATPLLQRGAKALVPTAAGKEYLVQVRAALGLLGSMPLHQRSTQRLQRLRVTAPPTFARQILVPALHSFTTAHPDIELELLLSIPYLAHSPHDSDITVFADDGAADTATPASDVLLAERVIPVAAPALIRRLPPLREPEDLEHATLLRTPLEPWTPWLRAAGLAWPEPASGTKLVDLGLTLEAAVSGQGVALARPALARHWLDTGTLQPLFNISVPAAQPYRLAPHAAHGAAAVFAHWLRGACADAQAWSHAWLSGRA
jgi:LysR family glycine cleavage system transcriptional activator